MTKYNRYDAKPNFRLTVDVNPPADRDNIASLIYDSGDATVYFHISRDQLTSLHTALAAAVTDLGINPTAPTESEMDAMFQESNQ